MATILLLQMILLPCLIALEQSEDDITSLIDDMKQSDEDYLAKLLSEKTEEKEVRTLDEIVDIFNKKLKHNAEQRKSALITNKVQLTVILGIWALLCFLWITCNVRIYFGRKNSIRKSKKRYREAAEAMLEDKRQELENEAAEAARRKERIQRRLEQKYQEEQQREQTRASPFMPVQLLLLPNASPAKDVPVELEHSSEKTDIATTSVESGYYKFEEEKHRPSEESVEKHRPLEESVEKNWLSEESVEKYRPSEDENKDLRKKKSAESSALKPEKPGWAEQLRKFRKRRSSVENARKGEYDNIVKLESSKEKRAGDEGKKKDSEEKVPANEPNEKTHVGKKEKKEVTAIDVEKVEKNGKIEKDKESEKVEKAEEKLKHEEHESNLQSTTRQ